MSGPNNNTGEVSLIYNLNANPIKTNNHPYPFGVGGNQIGNSFLRPTFLGVANDGPNGAGNYTGVPAGCGTLGTVAISGELYWNQPLINIDLRDADGTRHDIIYYDDGTQDYGCTDFNATNYDSTADFDDGTCFYAVRGVTTTASSIVNDNNPYGLFNDTNTQWTEFTNSAYDQFVDSSIYMSFYEIGTPGTFDTTVEDDLHVGWYFKIGTEVVRVTSSSVTTESQYNINVERGAIEGYPAVAHGPDEVVCIWSGVPTQEELDRYECHSHPNDIEIIEIVSYEEQNYAHTKLTLNRGMNNTTARPHFAGEKVFIYDGDPLISGTTIIGETSTWKGIELYSESNPQYGLYNADNTEILVGIEGTPNYWGNFNKSSL